MIVGWRTNWRYNPAWGARNGKTGNIGKPVGPLADGLTDIVNMQRATEMVKW